jgi:polysaccharide pyruvyl transferase WcaK-like protein
MKRKPSRPLRICLTGKWSSSDNGGDNAMLAGIRDCFPPDTQFTVFGSSPERVRTVHGLDGVAPGKNLFGLYSALTKAYGHASASQTRTG